METVLIVVIVLGVFVFAKPLKRVVDHTDRLVAANTTHDQVKWEEIAKKDIDRLIALGGNENESFVNKLTEMLNARR